MKPGITFLALVSFVLFAGSAPTPSNESESFTPRDFYQATLEPQNGVLTGAGQDEEGFQGYLQALGSKNAPVLYMSYMNLKNEPEKALKNLSRLMRQSQSKTGAYMIAQIGLAMTYDGNPQSHYEQEVAAGLYDKNIDALCRGIRDLGYPVLLRIGYEFNGVSWNGYRSDSYKQAFVRIAKKIREYRLDCATCWDASAVSQVIGNVNEFYPGDEWVDWWGINLFNVDEFSDSRVEQFMTDAKAHKKPVLIGESTPKNIGVLQGLGSWNAWYVQYFQFIHSHPGIKAISYINWNWAKFPQWSDWGDARLEQNSEVGQKFVAEIERPLYLKNASEKDLRLALRDYGKVAKPEPVKNLKGTFVGNGVKLSWSEDQAVRRWEVYRSNHFVGVTAVAEFLDTSIEASEKAVYTVVPFNTLGEKSKASSPLSVAVPSVLEKLENGDFKDGLSGWTLNLNQSGDGSLQLDQNGFGQGPCAKVEITKGNTNWHAQFLQGFTVHKGKTYTLTATIKADQNCRIEVFFQQAHSPYSSPLHETFTVGPDPQKVTWKLDYSGDEDQLNCTFMLGTNPGRTFWFGSLSVKEK